MMPPADETSRRTCTVAKRACSAICGLSMLGILASPVGAAKPKTAAAAQAIVGLVGFVELEATALSECAATDPANKDVYDALSLRLRALYKPYYRRAHQILPAAARSAGFPDGAKYSRDVLAALRQMAQAQIGHLFARGPRAQALATCRKLIADGHSRTGPFAAPSDALPAEVRVIEMWRQSP